MTSVAVIHPLTQVPVFCARLDRSRLMSASESLIGRLSSPSTTVFGLSRIAVLVRDHAHCLCSDDHLAERATIVRLQYFSAAMLFVTTPDDDDDLDDAFDDEEDDDPDDEDEGDFAGWL
jgi:hypothetical protein